MQGKLSILNNLPEPIFTDNMHTNIALQDIIAIGIAAGGYFCGAIPLAVYAGRWRDFNNVSQFGSAPVASAASATSVS